MTTGLLFFVCTALGFWTTMNWYAYANLAAMGFDRAVLLPVIWALAFSFPVARALTLRWRNPAMRLLYWTAALWMGSVIARRGRKLKVRNAEAHESWQREVAEKRAAHEQAYAPTAAS